MRVITDLSGLIKELDKSSKDEYAAIGAKLNIPPNQLQQYSHWNSKFYTRNCIKRTDHYELILLCWEEGQVTPIHCHGGEECWVYVIEGSLKETHYLLDNQKLSLENVEILSKGEKSFMCDELGFHKLANINEGRSISPHLYMDPINSCGKFDEKTKKFEQVDLSYYSYEGKRVTELI